MLGESVGDTVGVGVGDTVGVNVSPVPIFMHVRCAMPPLLDGQNFFVESVEQQLRSVQMSHEPASIADGSFPVL